MSYGFRCFMGSALKLKSLTGFNFILQYFFCYFFLVLMILVGVVGHYEILNQGVQAALVGLFCTLMLVGQGYLLLSRWNSIANGIGIVEGAFLSLIAFIPILSIPVALLLSVPWEKARKPK